MGLQCGIVGLPNVGKSTIFNALTAAGIAAENYPFCTIEPNAGVVIVPDGRLQALDEIVHSKQVVPAVVEFVDIAGLVRGASQGEGLGNQFLGHIRETDSIAHVVRCFEDENVTHVDGYHHGTIRLSYWLRRLNFLFDHSYRIFNFLFNRGSRPINFLFAH